MIRAKVDLMVASGDPRSSRRIDEVVYGRKG
jgi:hypothetical protein